jgi:hypothetical protein
MDMPRMSAGKAALFEGEKQCRVKENRIVPNYVTPER